MRSRKEGSKLVPALTRCNIRETAVLVALFLHGLWQHEEEEIINPLGVKNAV